MMRTFRFDEIAYNSTQKVKPTEADKEHYIGLEHIDGECLYISRWGSDVAPIGEKLVMRKGDILFGKRRAYQRKVAIAPIDGIFSAHGLVLRPKEDVVDKDYFPFFMSSNQFLDRAVQISVGGLSPTINWKDLARQEFTLPSLSEQKVLADKLWAAYRVKESYKKLLAATDDMLKAKFSEMFGENYKVPLHTVCATLIDGDWIESKDQSNTGVRLIQTGNIGVGDFKNKEDKSRFITQETFERLNCTEIFPGDVLISRLPDPIGRACILPKYIGKAITAVDCTIIRLNDKMLPEFFIANTLSNYYNQQILSGIKGTTRLRISRRDLSLINILCPPLPLQKQFAEIATQAEATKESLRKSIENIDQVIKSLINQ